MILNDSVIADYQRNSGFNFRELRNALKNTNGGTKTTRIAQYFDSLGFFQLHWDTLSKDTVRVIPGIRSRVTTENVSGIDTGLLSYFPSIKIPYQYDAGRIRQRADQLNRVLADNGYPFANVTIDVNGKNECGDVSLRYIVFTDQFCRFVSPSFYGPFVTRKKILLNDFKIRHGDIFNLQKVVESEKRLKNRQYIKEVIISAPEINYSGEDNAEMVSVPVYIADRSGLGLEGTAGFAASNGLKPSFYGNLRLSLFNLLHTGESAMFDYAGDKTYQKLKLEISKPWLFNTPLSIDASMELEVVQEQYGFLSGQAAIFSEIGTMWRIGLGVNASEITPRDDSTAERGTFIGADFILARIPEQIKKGEFSRELILKSGSGVSRKSKNYSRTHFDFLAGVHLPAFGWQAFQARVVSKHLITKEENLIPAELYRVGGYNSIRGYSDNEFPFRTVLFGQLEYLLYFTSTGAVYIFSDGGIGFEKEIDLYGAQRYMFGYGVGIRLPSRIGNMTMEWARNLNDHKSFGRIHIRFQNELAYNSGKTLSRF